VNWPTPGDLLLGNGDQEGKRCASNPWEAEHTIPTTRLMIGINIIPARRTIAIAFNIEMHSRNGV
jgi:hypothetical protein